MFKKTYILGLILSLCSVLIALGETYKYPGFYLKHFQFSPLWIYGSTALFIKFFPPPNPNQQLFSRSFRYLAIFSIIFSGLLLIVETATFPNYVFSTLHINLDGLQILTVLFFSFFVLTNLRHERLLMLVDTTAVIAVTSILLNYFMANLITDVTLIRNEIHLIRIGGKTYEEKQIAGWGDIYRYSLLLKKTTPEHAVIALPPAQNHWLYSGNLVLMRYFLYPRTLVNVKETNSTTSLYEMPKGDYEYVALIWGESNPLDTTARVWPKTEFAAEYIDYFNLSEQTITRVNVKLYKPDSESEISKGWGVIKKSPASI